MAVFNRRGYEAATLQHIARAAGLSKSSIYHHISSKEELLARGVARALDALFAILEEPGTREGRPAARLRHVLLRTVEITLTRLPEVSLLLRIRGNTRTQQAVLARRRQFDHLVAEIVEEAARAQELRGDVAPRLITRLLFGLSNSTTEWYRPGSGMDVASVAEAIFKLAFEGLGSGVVARRRRR